MRRTVLAGGLVLGAVAGAASGWPAAIAAGRRPRCPCCRAGTPPCPGPSTSARSRCSASRCSAPAPPSLAALLPALLAARQDVAGRPDRPARRAPHARCGCRSPACWWPAPARRSRCRAPARAASTPSWPAPRSPSSAWSPRRPRSSGLAGRLGPLLPAAPRLALRDAARNRARTAPAVAAVLAAVAGSVAVGDVRRQPGPRRRRRATRRRRRRRGHGVAVARPTRPRAGAALARREARGCPARRPSSCSALDAGHGRRRGSTRAGVERAARDRSPACPPASAGAPRALATARRFEGRPRRRGPGRRARALLRRAGRRRAGARPGRRARAARGTCARTAPPCCVVHAARATSTARRAARGGRPGRRPARAAPGSSRCCPSRRPRAARPAGRPGRAGRAAAGECRPSARRTGARGRRCRSPPSASAVRRARLPEPVRHRPARAARRQRPARARRLGHRDRARGGGRAAPTWRRWPPSGPRPGCAGCWRPPSRWSPRGSAPCSAPSPGWCPPSA